jgi:hypothetical protein
MWRIDEGSEDIFVFMYTYFLYVEFILNPMNRNCLYCNFILQHICMDTFYLFVYTEVCLKR